MNFKIFAKSFFIIIVFLIASYTGNCSTIKFAFNSITNSISADSIKVLRLQKRVQEIQAMNHSNLSSIEKKDLRNELKQLLKEAKSYNKGNNSGVYISVGALIIIIILLILILR